MPPTYPNHGRIDGPVVLIGFGSIGQGTLPLIERHFTYDPHQVHVIEPSDAHRTFLEQRGVHFIHHAITRENCRALLGQLFPDGRGFCVNLSVDTSSLDLMKLTRELGVLYIDTVVEPWAGHYFDLSLDPGHRTNYALREAVRAEKRANPGGPTAVSCCGANPGMVSWLLKEALLRLGADVGQPTEPPSDRAEWARLMQSLGVKGVHIAERDTQSGRDAKPLGSFVNTWSVEGFISESFQPAELGWGTHETWFPPNGHRQAAGCQAAIYLDTPGILTKVHTWTPAAGPQYGYLVTHNEAISIADYFTIGDAGSPDYRPTCHYAYHPCDQAVLSLHETLGSGRVQERFKISRRERDSLGRRRSRSAALRPCAECALVRLPTVDPGDAGAGAVPERHRAAGDECGDCRNGLGAGASARRDRRDRRDGPRLLPCDPAPLSRSDRGTLYRLDADFDPLAAVRRGDRRERPLAVPERAGHVRRDSGLRRRLGLGFDRAKPEGSECVRSGSLWRWRWRGAPGLTGRGAEGPVCRKWRCATRGRKWSRRGGDTLGLAVRTFVPAAEADGWREIAGAQCRVTGGDLFRADVVTPVRLRVQDLGPDAPPLRADCTSGALKGAAVVAPAYGWPVEGRPAAVHRIWWGGGWWWGFQKTGPMAYPDLAVGMK